MGRFIDIKLRSTISTDKAAFDAKDARRFCFGVVKHYWSGVQRDHSSPWPLPESEEGFGGTNLSDQEAQLARQLGEAAARLGPAEAGSCIGGIYTALLPEQMQRRTRSSYGSIIESNHIMEVEALSKRLADLPEWAQLEVAECIAALEAQRGQSKAATHRPLSKEPFVGLWKDRDDLSDSSTWVRDLRRREWVSRHG